MKKTNKKAPEIRFPEFTDDWEQRKLEDVTSEFKSGSFIAAAEIEETGEYPVYGGNGLRGYSETYNHDGEFALIGRQGALCGNMNYSTGKAYFTEHAVAVKANDLANTKFLYYLLDKMNLGQYSDQSAQPGLAVGKIIKLKNMFPSKEEQDRIGDYFTNFDHLITLHQRKCDKIKKLKSCMLQKMFPRKGDTKPEIRFPEFTDDWEQRKLYEIAEFNPKSELPETFEYVDLESVVGTEMVSHRTETRETAPSRAQRLAQTGDVFFQTVRPYQRNNYLFAKPDNNYVFSTGYAQMRPKIDAKFLMCFLQTDSFVKVVLDNCTGTSYPAINSNDLSNLEIVMPASDDEQIRIGSFITNLDNLITLHQRKCDELKNLKKGMIQKMFV